MYESTMQYDMEVISNEGCASKGPQLRVYCSDNESGFLRQLHICGKT